MNDRHKPHHGGPGDLLLCLVATLTLGVMSAVGMCHAEESLFQDPSTADGAEKVEVTARPSEKDITKALPADTAAPAEKTEAAALPKPADAEKTETADDKNKDKMVPLDSMLTPPLPEEEKGLNGLIRDSVKGAVSGSRSAAKNMKVIDISTRIAAIHALERALTIQLSAHDDEIRRLVIQEAKAVFLPVFSVGPRYDNTNTFERKEELTVAQKIARQKIKFFKDIPGGAAPGSDPSVLNQTFFKNGEVQFVDPKSFDHFYTLSSITDEFGQSHQIVVDQNLKTGEQTIAAEDGGIKNFLRDKKLGYIDPNLDARELGFAWNYNVATKRKRADPRESIPISIRQQLPWGPAISVTLTEAYHDKPYDGFGHTWDRPWYTNFSTSLFLPLPGTKNFGPYAPQDVSLRITKLDEKRALWDLKALINSTLLASDLRFLSLVNAIKNVESTTYNRKTVEALQKQTADQLGLQRATQYGKDQVDAEVLRVREFEERAWGAYISASNGLVELLNLDPNTLLIPVGYSKTINEHPAFKIEEAVKQAMEHRAELKSASSQVTSAEVFLSFAKQQSRPDISVTSTVTWDQTQNPNSGRFRGETGIGYNDPGLSLLNTFNSDSLFESYTFTFRRQLFNRAEHARVERSSLQLDQQHLSQRLIENQVVQQVNDALATLTSASAAVTAAAARLDSSRKAYDLTVDMQKEGRITEFEVVSKNQDRLDAEIGLNNALIRYKSAETQLLFSEGMLPNDYPEKTSPNEFDKYRLGLLKASSALHFFGDGKDKEAK